VRKNGSIKKLTSKDRSLKTHGVNFGPGTDEKKKGRKKKKRKMVTRTRDLLYGLRKTPPDWGFEAKKKDLRFLCLRGSRWWGKENEPNYSVLVKIKSQERGDAGREARWLQKRCGGGGSVKE